MSPGPLERLTSSTYDLPPPKPDEAPPSKFHRSRCVAESFSPSFPGSSGPSTPPAVPFPIPMVVDMTNGTRAKQADPPPSKVCRSDILEFHSLGPARRRRTLGRSSDGAQRAPAPSRYTAHRRVPATLQRAPPARLLLTPKSPLVPRRNMRNMTEEAHPERLRCAPAPPRPEAHPGPKGPSLLPAGRYAPIFRRTPVPAPPSLPLPRCPTPLRRP